MKFTTLKIENFLSIETAEIQLADRGLVLIQGVNEDNSSALSNGSGKSSVADALCWCLYGATARGVSGDAVVNRAAGKDTMVSVDILDGAESYTITRYRKSKTHKNALRVEKNDGTGAAMDLTKGTDKLTQEAVDQIIGSSYDVFRAAVYAGQESMPDLPAMTDKQLKMLVEEAAGVSVLEAAYEQAKIEAKLADEALAKVTAALTSAAAALALERSNLVTYENGMEEYEEKRKDAIDGLNVCLADLKTEEKALSDEIAALDKPKIEKAIAELEDKIAAVTDERKTEAALERELRDAELALVRATAEVKTWRADYDKAKDNLDKCAALVGTPCPECDKPFVEEDIADQRDRLKKRLGEVAGKAPDMKKIADNAKECVRSVRETLDAFRATMTDVSETSAQIASLREELDLIRAKEGDLAAVLRNQKVLEAEVARRLSDSNPFKEMVEETKGKITFGEEVVAKGEEAVEKAEEDQRLSATVLKVFSPAGVRAHILDEVTPFLNDQTAKYLASLTDGNTTATWSTLVRTAKGELREKFSIEVLDSTGGESFAALSGGEKRKVRIASALALQDLVARRATKPIELFVGDEIDDALDEAGLERLAGILEEKARERGSVFIISHNDLKDWVPAAITVTKRGGKTVVTDETA